MGNIIRQVRGTSDEHASYIGETGVISLVTNEVFEPTGEIRVHDGKTPGGINPVDAGIAAVSSVTSDMFVGMIASFGMETPPDGWHICNGGEYSLANYPELYAVIGTTWGELTDGSGDTGDTHFRVPDLRGAFLRGTGTHSSSQMVDENNYSGPSVGQLVNDATARHKHFYRYADSRSVTVSPEGGSGGYSSYTWGSTYQGKWTDNYVYDYYGTGRNREDYETRPFNAGINYCIKY